MRRIIFTVFMVLSLIVLGSCGYHLAGTGSTLPRHIKKIYIPPIKNNTARAEVETYMTAALRDEMARRGKEVVDKREDADAELVGSIDGFRVYPVGITTSGESRRFSIFITGKFVLKDLKTDMVLFSSSSYTFRDEYEAQGTGAVNFLSLQTEAIDKIARKFARSIVSTILEGF